MGVKNGLERAADGTWRYVVRVRVGGRIVMRRRKGARTKEEARQLQQKAREEIRGGSSCSLTVELRTFEDIVRAYREYRGPFSRTHEYNVERLEQDLGDYEVTATPTRLEQYLRALRSEDKNHQANRFVEVARAAFQVVVDLGWMNKNPITPVRFPESEETPRDVVISGEDIGHLVLTAARNRRTAHIARALQYYFSVPCRKSELVAMKVQDVDQINMAIRVYCGTTKNEMGAWKPIPPWMQNWVRRRCRESEKTKDDPLFCRMVGGCRLPLGDFKNAWGTARKAAGFPDLRIHDSRHVSATYLTDNGTPEQVMMTIAGWKTNMLRTYYNRNPKQALTLVRFERKRESNVNPFLKKEAANGAN